VNFQQNYVSRFLYLTFKQIRGEKIKILALGWLWIHYWAICINILPQSDREIFHNRWRYWRSLRRWANVLLLLLLLLLCLLGHINSKTFIGGRMKIRLEKTTRFSQLCLWSLKSSETWRRIVGRVLFDVSIDRSGAILLGLHYIKDEGTLTLSNIRKYSPRDTVSHPRREIIIIIIIIIIICFQIYSRLLVVTWQSSGKSISEQEIKEIYPCTLWMKCAVFIIIIIIMFLKG